MSSAKRVLCVCFLGLFFLVFVCLFVLLLLFCFVLVWFCFGGR